MEGVPNRAPADDNLISWFGNGLRRNLAIVAGAVSDIVVVDCDSAEAIAWADVHLPPTPMITRTAKGEHRFYRHPGTPIRNKARIRTDDGRIAIDVRADGGYVVGPGSQHASGVTYERVGEWPPVEELPVFDPAWLTPAEPLGVELDELSPSPRLQSRGALLRRARKYLKATPPAIEGQGGDNHTFQVCCRLVRGFDLGDAEALDLLHEWNARCVPPWSEPELAAKVEAARKYGDEPIGARITDPRHYGPPLPVASEPAAAVSVGSSHEDRLTEAGAAERFARLHGDDLRFDHRRARWLMWHGHRWAPDVDAAVTRTALDFARAWQREAVDIGDHDRREATFKAAIRLERRVALIGLLALASHLRPIANAGDAWDTNPMLLGVPNGVVDLLSGTLRPGARDDSITLNNAVPFETTAACPRWLRFLDEVFAGDRPSISFVHRAVGYSLTGQTGEQCLFLLYGTGSNGKGTFANTLKRTLGDYAWNMPFSTLEMRDRSAIPNDLAALVGRRLVVASETNDGVRLNEARIKALTGCDPVTARFLHGEFFEFEPVGKFWLCVNHRPVVRDDSHGFWRRIRLIPFAQRFDVDQTLADALTAEASGILAWAVRGCLAWQEQGLAVPAVISEATLDYERESDELADFLAEAIDLEDGSVIRPADLYAHYVRWAKDAGLSEREMLSNAKFGRKVGERFKAVRIHDKKHYIGLARRLP